MLRRGFAKLGEKGGRMHHIRRLVALHLAAQRLRCEEGSVRLDEQAFGGYGTRDRLQGGGLRVCGVAGEAEVEAEFQRGSGLPGVAAENSA